MVLEVFGIRGERSASADPDYRPGAGRGMTCRDVTLDLDRFDLETVVFMATRGVGAKNHKAIRPTVHAAWTRIGIMSFYRASRAPVEYGMHVLSSSDEGRRASLRCCCCLRYPYLWMPKSVLGRFQIGTLTEWLVEELVDAAAGTGVYEHGPYGLD
jgi:hypothetical protein